MRKGSLLMLARPLTPDDLVAAEANEIILPEKGVLYVAASDPQVLYSDLFPWGVDVIAIEELGDALYSCCYFIEVQGPMEINLNNILTT